MLSSSQDLQALGRSLPPQYPHLRGEKCGSDARKSFSLSLSQAVTFVSRKQVHPVSLPLH